MDKGKVVNKKMSREERLAALRAKVATIDLGGSAGFWTAKAGRNQIRILPEVGEMGFFFQSVGKHFMPPDRKKTIYCPKFTSDGELDCPVCDYVDELYKSGDKAAKELAGELRVKKSFWMNIIDRSNEKAGPQIYTPGVTVFSAISSLIGDPDYGDIYDVEEGLDIVVEKTGEKLDTEYQVKTRRQSTPLSEDPELVEKWLKDAKDISYVEVSEDPEEDRTLAGKHALFVLPYDRISKEFLDEVAEEVDDEVEEDEPVTKKGKSAPTPVSKPKAVAKDEEDDEEEEDSQDDGEDDVEKEVSTRRAARRSFRR